MKMKDSLITLYETLTEGLSHLPGIQYCGLLPSRRDAITLPAIFLDMVELQASQDPGTGELELIAHWDAHVLVSKQQSKLMLWQLVQAILVWLYQHNWLDPHIGPAQLKQASPDHFNPDYPGEQLWLVAWTQRLRIGENLWNGQGVIIDTLYTGFPGAPREIIEINHHGT